MRQKPLVPESFTQKNPKPKPTQIKEVGSSHPTVGRRTMRALASASRVVSALTARGVHDGIDRRRGRDVARARDDDARGRTRRRVAARPSGDGRVPDACRAAASPSLEPSPRRARRRADGATTTTAARARTTRRSRRRRRADRTVASSSPASASRRRSASGEISSGTGSSPVARAVRALRGARTSRRGSEGGRR